MNLLRPNALAYFSRVSEDLGYGEVTAWEWGAPTIIR